jgi:hypothetical protein
MATGRCVDCWSGPSLYSSLGGKMSNQEIIEFLVEQLNMLDAQRDSVQAQIDYLRSITPQKNQED